jgi:hypothetical protein
MRTERKVLAVKLNRNSVIKAFCLLFFLFAYSFANAQTATISGTVKDEINNAVPYANVVLKTPADSGIYKGEITNENGEFVFQNVKPGDYFLEVIFTGFNTHTRPGISVREENQQLNLGEIKLTSQSKQLNAVTVVGEKPFIEKQADKTVVNIENSIIQNGSSIIEVFEKLPGVIVDQDGNIKIRGKQGVIVVIDGKQTALSGQDLVNMLKGMSASNIQKIEIITNPSAKWDASGNSGILNIIMKKNKLDGYNGNVSLNYGQGRYPKYITSFTFNYKKDKLSLYFNYGYAYRKSFNNLTLTRRFFENNVLNTTFVTDNYIVFPFKTHTPRFGADYSLSDKTTVSFLASGVNNEFTPSTTNHTDILGPGNERTSSFDFSQRSLNNFNNYDLNAQINHRFDTSGQSLVINLDHAKYWNTADQRLSTLYSDYQNSASNMIYLNGKQDGLLNLYSFKADYSRPLGSSMTLETGVKSSRVESDRDMRFYNVQNTEELFDTARSSHFLYNENINAAYISLNKKFGRLTVQTGLRAEQTIAEGLQKLNNQSFDRNYFQLFPTVYLDYTISEKHNVNANLGRRINRPGYEQMNPFRRLIDFTTYSEGNPYLLPELSYNAELAYSYANTYNVTFSYSVTTDNITDVLIQDSETRTTSQTIVNLARMNYYSVDFSYTKRLTSWWKTNTSILSYFPKFTGVVNRFAISQGQPSFYVNSNNSFSLSENLSAELTFRYNHQNLYGVTLEKTSSNVIAGIQKTVLQKKGTITLNVTDIFWNSFPRGVTTFSDVDEHWTSRRDTRVINIGFTYKFGTGKTGRMRKETGAEEEKKRI